MVTGGSFSQVPWSPAEQANTKVGGVHPGGWQARTPWVLRRRSRRRSGLRSGSSGEAGAQPGGYGGEAFSRHQLPAHDLSGAHHPPL
jgi:hypothetical protein